MKTKLTCAAFLVAGVIIGRLLPVADGPENPEPANGDLPTRGGAPVSAIINPDAGLSPLQEDLEAQADPGRDGDDLVMVPASLLEELSLAAGKRSLAQNLFSADGKIEEIFQISDQEKAAVQTAWRGVQQRIRELEAESSVSDDLDDGSVRIIVPDLTDDMAALGSGVRSSVIEILGENRGDGFLAMMQVDRILTPPAGERTYTVAAEATGDGDWRFRMTLDGANGRRVWVGESIPDEIQHLAGDLQFVPE
jgi:hypothetical protein